MTDISRDEYLKKAKLASRVGVFGAIGFVALVAVITYVLAGSINWWVLIFALIPATFHYLGCKMFKRYFTTLANDVDDAKDPK